MALRPPVQVKVIPTLVTHEGAPFGPIDLKLYIKSLEDSGPIQFVGELEGGQAFPQGIICTKDGLISGIAATGTQGEYDLLISAKNDDEEVLEVLVEFSIKPKLSVDDPLFAQDLKSQIWKALGSNAPIPELNDFWTRPITPQEMQYLFQRFAVLTIWDAFNLESPSKKNLLSLEGVSPHYQVYDRGSCLVAAPKDLYSHERTLEDALQTARAMAREVYKRGWTIEFAGFNKMIRAAWVELQYLGNKHGNKLEILHFEPTLNDLKLFEAYTPKAGPSPT